MVEKINEWKGFCLALDIPTGLSSDGGSDMGLHVEADATISYGFPKTGMAFYPAVASVGKLKVVNISFPQTVLDESDFDAWLLDGDYVQGKMPPRPPSAHKGHFGHAVVTGGATGMGGAIGLAALAALKVGAGLVTAAVPKVLSQKFELGIKEVISYHLGDKLDNPDNAEALTGFCRDKSVLLIGPGMGRGSGLTDLVTALVESVSVPLVIDADGLNNLAPRKDALTNAKAPVIITPHPGEMSRLTGKTAKEINSDRLGSAKEFSREYGCITVLKGARTVIAAPDGTAYINPTGNPNLASGGTGDVLSGMIAGFVSQGLAPLDAAAISVYLHGLAADIYSEEENAYSLSAGDLLDYVPKAITKLTK
jgi:NAD(P)H-hydrate epimerase